MGFELDTDDRHEQDRLADRIERIKATMNLASEIQQNGVQLRHHGDKDPRTKDTVFESLLNDTLDNG